MIRRLHAGYELTLAVRDDEKEHQEAASSGPKRSVPRGSYGQRVKVRGKSRTPTETAAEDQRT